MRKENGNGKSMEDLLNKPTNGNSKTGEELVVLEVEDFKLISEELQAEVISTVRSQFTGSVMYNIPRRSSNGKMSWPACDRMPNGYCPYKDTDKHIHIVDVGIHGALVAAGVYGNLEFGSEDAPTIREEGDKLYWVVEVFCNDLVRGNRIKRWEFEPVMKRDRSGGFYEDEFAMKTVQSKGIRNMILAIIPPQLRELWKQDYLAGREPFDPARVLETGGRGTPQLPPKEEKKKLPPKKEKKEEKKEEKKKANTQGSNDLSQVIKGFAEKHKLSPDLVGIWCDIEFETPGKAMLKMTQAMQDNTEAAKYVEQIKEFDKKSGSDDGSEVEM